MLKLQKLKFVLANFSSLQSVALTKREGGNMEAMHKLVSFF